MVMKRQELHREKEENGVIMKRDEAGLTRGKNEPSAYVVCVNPSNRSISLKFGISISILFIVII